MTSEESGTVKVDTFLAALDDRAKRQALQNLRRIIAGAAPEAEEVITYGMPGFRQDGVLVSHNAFKNHCSFFPISDHVWGLVARDPIAEQTSKGTIRFQPDEPLSETLVTAIVQTRLAENAARKASKRKQ